MVERSYMSITEKDIIDGIAVTEDKKGIIFMISDHLTWEDEYNHLILLQEKINSYLTFWEEKQYIELYEEGEYACIEIYFKHRVPRTCKQFIKVVNEQISQLNIVIKICK